MQAFRLKSVLLWPLKLLLIIGVMIHCLLSHFLSIISSFAKYEDDEGTIQYSEQVLMKKEIQLSTSQTRERILIMGGRAPVALDYLRIFSKQGHEVHLVESPYYQPMFLSRFSKYATHTHYLSVMPNKNFDVFQRELAKICKDNEISLLLPTCEEVFHVARAKEFIEKETTGKCFIFTENIDHLKELHNKFDFVQYVSKSEQAFNRERKHAHVKAPKSILISKQSTSHELDEFWKECNGEIVMKPSYSRFASQTIVKPTRDNYLEIVKNIREHPEQTWVAQKYIHGSLLCTYSVCQNGKMLAHTCYVGGKHTPNGTPVGSTVYFEQLNNKEISHAMEQWISNLVQERNYTGQISFDFIAESTNDLVHNTESQTIYVLECNPRATSGVHLFADNSQAFSLCFLKSNEGDMALKDSNVVYPNPITRKQILGGMILSLLVGCQSVRLCFNWLFDVMKCGVERDVLFEPNDFLPFYIQILFLIDPFIKMFRFGVGLLETMTFDIEWNGEM